MTTSTARWGLSALAVGSIDFARPKSSTFTAPSGRTLIFAGFRSRWTIPCSVRRFKGLGNVFRDRQCLVERDRATGDPLREILTLNEFHDERVGGARFFKPVNRRDVGMIQRRERLRLAFEPCQAFGVSGERVRQDLDRDLAAKRRCRSPDTPSPCRSVTS